MQCLTSRHCVANEMKKIVRKMGKLCTKPCYKKPHSLVEKRLLKQPIIDRIEAATKGYFLSATAIFVS